MKKSSITFLFRSLGSAFALAALLGAAGCGSDSSTDAAGACMTLCTSAGFSGSMVDVQSHETNCFCTGSGGTVTPALCTTMCTGLNKPNSQPFKSGVGAANNNACQCS